MKIEIYLILASLHCFTTLKKQSFDFNQALSRGVLTKFSLSRFLSLHVVSAPHWVINRLVHGDMTDSCKRCLSCIISLKNDNNKQCLKEILVKPASFSGALLGSFSTDDSKDSENVTLKMSSRFFKLFLVYSNSLEMSKVGKFPGR